jgi:hypothetical protein
MEISIVKLLGSQLQGQILGKKHFAKVCEKLVAATPGEIVTLDFANVELVTGSWINAFLTPLIRWAAEEHNDLFPVICNADSAWLDDLRLVAELSHQCYLVTNDSARPPVSATLIGALDRGQQQTFSLVLGRGEATGAELERQKPKEGIGATAWNNRLKDLFSKRLIRRVKRGREQVYFPVVKEIDSDG